jgi:hypothetical protein
MILMLAYTVAHSRQCTKSITIVFGLLLLLLLFGLVLSGLCATYSSLMCTGIHSIKQLMICGCNASMHSRILKTLVSCTLFPNDAMIDIVDDDEDVDVDVDDDEGSSCFGERIGCSNNVNLSASSQ